VTAQLAVSTSDRQIANLERELAGKLTLQERGEKTVALEEAINTRLEQRRELLRAQFTEEDRLRGLEERKIAALLEQKNIEQDGIVAARVKLNIEKDRQAALQGQINSGALDPAQLQEKQAQLNESNGKVAAATRAVNAVDNADFERRFALEEQSLRLKATALGLDTDASVMNRLQLGIDQERVAQAKKLVNDPNLNDTQRAAARLALEQAEGKVLADNRASEALRRTETERIAGLAERTVQARLQLAGLGNDALTVARVAEAMDKDKLKSLKQELAGNLTAAERAEKLVQLEELRGKLVTDRQKTIDEENTRLERQLALSQRLVTAALGQSGQDGPQIAAAASLAAVKREKALLERELAGPLSVNDRQEKEVKLAELKSQQVQGERTARVALYGEANRLLDVDRARLELGLKQKGLDDNGIATAQLERDYTRGRLELLERELKSGNLTDTEKNALLKERLVLQGQEIDNERKVFDERYKQVALNLATDNTRAQNILKSQFRNDGLAAAGVSLESAKATLATTQNQLAEGEKLKLSQAELNKLVLDEENARQGVLDAEYGVSEALKARKILQDGLDDSFTALSRAARAEGSAVGQALNGLSDAQRNLGRASADAAPYLEKVARGEELSAEEAIKAKPAFDALTSSINAKRQALKAASDAYKQQALAIGDLRDAIATLDDLLNPGGGAGGKRTNERVNERANQALTDLQTALATNDPAKISAATIAFNSAFGAYQKLIDDNSAAAKDARDAQEELTAAKISGDSKRIEEATRKLAEAKKRYADLGGSDVTRNQNLESGARDAFNTLDSKKDELKQLEDKNLKKAASLKAQSEAAQVKISENSVKIVDSLAKILEALDSGGLFKDLFKGVPEQAATSGFLAGQAFQIAFENERKTLMEIFKRGDAENAAFEAAFGVDPGAAAADDFVRGYQIGLKKGQDQIEIDIKALFNGLSQSSKSAGINAAETLLGGFRRALLEGDDKTAADALAALLTAGLKVISKQAEDEAKKTKKVVEDTVNKVKLDFGGAFGALPDVAARAGQIAGERLAAEMNKAFTEGLRKLNLPGIINDVKQRAIDAVNQANATVGARVTTAQDLFPQGPPVDNRSYQYTDNRTFNVTLPVTTNIPFDAAAHAREIVQETRKIQDETRRNTGECL